MNVNARGDKLDGNNQVIEQKNRQSQRQYQKQSNVSADLPVHTGTRKAREAAVAADAGNQDDIQSAPEDLAAELPSSPEPDETIVPIAEPAPVTPEAAALGGGGLAAAIARSKEVRQELEKTPRQKTQTGPLRKI
jgi:hypothetical protein